MTASEIREVNELLEHQVYLLERIAQLHTDLAAIPTVVFVRQNCKGYAEADRANG